MDERPRSPAAGVDDAVHAALLEFRRAGARHDLAAREPAILFASLPQVLQIAAGKGAGTDPALEDAALGFVRAALLRPNADHYGILGLTRSADAATIKEHYRLLMRLLHPDFATTHGQLPWPKDAPARLNLAYEVLSSPSRRKDYDQASRPAPRPVHVHIPKEPEASGTKPSRAPWAMPERSIVLKTLAGTFGGLGALGLAALVFSGGDVQSLVQRPSAARSEPYAVIAPPHETVQQQRAVSAPAPARTLATAPTQAAPTVTADAARPAPVPAPIHAPVQVANVIAPEAPAPSRAPVPEPAAATATALAAPPPGRTAAPVLLQPAPAPAIAVKEPLPTPPPPAVTMAEAHPLLAQLLQQLESGSADRVVGVLERDARSSPGTQAFARQYAALVNGGAPRVSRAQFKADSRDSRLVVTGHIELTVADAQSGTQARPLPLQAEFGKREGTVVMTRLTRVGE